MAVRERDPLTGHETTGHEWAGITELNTRVPRAVWWAIGITHVWALLYWVLMPAWPLVNTYTKGLLGADQRERVEEQVAAADVTRAQWNAQLAGLSADEIRADPALMGHVRQTAPALFGDNCSACHGRDAAGGPGFPSLVDDAWLWGGDAETIMETLRVGINSPHPETRYSQMLAFGRDGMLERGQVLAVVAYVRSLSGAEAPTETVEAGAAVFAENCTSCHGEDARGLTEIGAPNLTDSFWIYGGDVDSVYQSVWHGRQGWMPSWEGRLTDAERMMLTLYIQDLGEEGVQ